MLLSFLSLRVVLLVISVASTAFADENPFASPKSVASPALRERCAALGVGMEFQAVTRQVSDLMWSIRSLTNDSQIQSQISFSKRKLTKKSSGKTVDILVIHVPEKIKISDAQKSVSERVGEINVTFKEMYDRSAADLTRSQKFVCGAKLCLTAVASSVFGGLLGALASSNSLTEGVFRAASLGASTGILFTAYHAFLINDKFVNKDEEEINAEIFRKTIEDILKITESGEMKDQNNTVVVVTNAINR